MSCPSTAYTVCLRPVTANVRCRRVCVVVGLGNRAPSRNRSPAAARVCVSVCRPVSSSINVRPARLRLADGFGRARTNQRNVCLPNESRGNSVRAGRAPRAPCRAAETGRGQRGAVRRLTERHGTSADGELSLRAV